jgi:hypothetical protein
MILIGLAALFFGMALAQTITSTPVPLASDDGMPLTNFETADFSGSGICGRCHTNLTDDRYNDVSIDTQWRSTMMANASKDPFWQAKVSAEVLRNPALQSVIEDKCSTCHMPMGRTQANNDGSPVAIFGNGFLDPANPLHEAAMDGVSCTLCHQIQNVNLGQMESFSGHYTIDTSTSSPNRLIFGPYSNPLVNPMRNMSGFTPDQGAHIEDSGLCATCHTLFTPYVDAGGNVVGEFPEQTPYLEWEHSKYGDGVGSDDIQCQECHMPKADGAVVISNMPHMLSGREPFYKHYFVGGNAFMLKILKDNLTELGVSASTQQMEATIDRTLTQLQNKTGDITILDAQVANDQLSAQIGVTNLSGHKLPSGYPSRRVWIHMLVTDSMGREVFESGEPRSDGSITGNNAGADLSTFEPHYDTITSTEQVQIYEPIMIDTDKDVTYTLLRSAAYIKDNRLLPAGFDKTTADADVAVYGDAAQDSDFVGSGDQVTYQIDVTSYTAPFSVSVKLLYQSISYPFVKDLRKDNNTYITQFGDLYDAADKTPVQIDSGIEIVGDDSTVPPLNRKIYLPLIAR